MIINDYSLIAKQYASIDNTGTAYLAFKLIPEIIKNFASGIKTLDYGCGSGDSTIFLNELNLDVEGVDISKEMLLEAKELNKNTAFKLIKSAQLPYDSNTFDIVFSSFVLLEIETKSEMIKILNEIHRVLKKDGIFIAVTGSDYLYSHNWLSLDVNFEQNQKLKSGDIGAVLLKDADLVVYDYYWTNNDYKEVIETSNFSSYKTLFPLGEKMDGYSWVDEEKFPPYVVYVLLKT